MDKDKKKELMEKDAEGILSFLGGAEDCCELNRITSLPCAFLDIIFKVDAAVKEDFIRFVEKHVGKKKVKRGV